SAIRSSRRMSLLTKQLRVGCSNPECRCVFQVGVEVTGVYIQSAKPNPAVILQQLKGVGKHWDPSVISQHPLRLRSTIRPFTALVSASKGKRA
ncbi:MAG: ogr/Delta-like zinc finger family protein, partial [Aeromonas sp.]